MNQNAILKAIKIIRTGGVIAYPTEGVFGLGCDPFNEEAVQKILHLKHRLVAKGLVLIVSGWNQAKNLVAPIDSKILAKILDESSPATTWVFPVTTIVPRWIIGNHHSVALRITKHPIAKALCNAYQGALVSTSSNIEGEPPALTVLEVQNYFPKGLDFIVEGEVGDSKRPTMIRNALTNKILRG
jgi:L-threonylcarbamoyladenylate synthase